MTIVEWLMAVPIGSNVKKKNFWMENRKVLFKQSPKLIIINNENNKINSGRV